MLSWQHKLLFVIISVSFFISTSEMDLGKGDNTFFDEYDTYIKTEQISIYLSTFDTGTKTSSVLNNPDFLSFQSRVQEHQSMMVEAVPNCYPVSHRLYMRYSSWRI